MTVKKILQTSVVSDRSNFHTHQVRQLLASIDCSNALGRLESPPELMRQAVQLLEQHWTVGHDQPSQPWQYCWSISLLSA